MPGCSPRVHIVYVPCGAVLRFLIAMGPWVSCCCVLDRGVRILAWAVFPGGLPMSFVVHADSPFTSLHLALLWLLRGEGGVVFSHLF